MWARRGQCDQLVASFHPVTLDHAFLFYDTYTKSSQVEIAGCINARHLRGFPAYQGTASLLAARGYTSNHLFGHFETQFSSGIVVEKK